MVVVSSPSAELEVVGLEHQEESGRTPWTGCDPSHQQQQFACGRAGCNVRTKKII